MSDNSFVDPLLARIAGTDKLFAATRSDETRMAVYYRLMHGNPNYSRMWAAQAISLLGDWFNTIALATLVSSYTNESGLASSALLLCRFLPRWWWDLSPVCCWIVLIANGC
jgi:hypothetical protein